LELSFYLFIIYLATDVGGFKKNKIMAKKEENLGMTPILQFLTVI
jgi:hypothetical protein